jgi:hypothetical protein
MNTLEPIVELMDKTINRLEAIRSASPFDLFCREQYNQHPHRVIMELPEWKAKYMDELNEAWAVELGGTI